MPIFSIIVAVAENNIIGLKGDMPWLKLRSDLKYFKQKTTIIILILKIDLSKF